MSRYWDVRRAVKHTEKSFTPQEIFARWQELGIRLQPEFIDREYWGVSLDAWKKFVAYTKLDKLKYERERYDCDDFALCFKAEAARRFRLNGVGLVLDISSGHAYTAIIVNKLGKPDIYFLEPQTDQIGVRRAGSKNHKALKGKVLF